MAAQIDISREPDTTGWQTGTASIRGATYSVALKRSARPSGFGIDNGRIFKLEITTPRGRRAVDYDRGWFACPKDGPDAEVFEAVLAAFNGPDHEGGWVAEEDFDSANN